MKFVECHQTNYKKGRTNPVKYIVIHFTSNDGDTAANNLNYYAKTPNLSASAHYYIDENEICQSVKDTDTAWHCGSKTYIHSECRNSNSIGVELCSRYNGNIKADKQSGKVDFSKYYFKRETILNAVLFTKELVKKYDIPLQNVIRHFDVTGKICPAPFVLDGSLWNEFKNKLVKKIILETGNDIVWELMNGKNKIEISEPKRAIKALDEAKNDDRFMSLYWIIHKIVNK